MTSLCSLPNPVLVLIVRALVFEKTSSAVRSVAALRSSCKRLRELLSRNAVWQLLCGYKNFAKAKELSRFVDELGLRSAVDKLAHEQQDWRAVFRNMYLVHCKFCQQLFWCDDRIKCWKNNGSSKSELALIHIAVPRDQEVLLRTLQLNREETQSAIEDIMKSQELTEVKFNASMVDVMRGRPSNNNNAMESSGSEWN